MASKTEGEKLQGFICPLCLDVFKNATLLNCGHTFCRGCLEAYDDQHHDLDHITCPVCRQKTDLGQKRVAGLTPNFSLKCLEDSLNVDDRSSSREQEDSTSEFCSLHKKEPRTIFCEACEEFICLSCYIEHHQGHRIKKKEELERDIKKRTAVLLPKCKERQIQISKSVEIGDYHKRTINLHFDNMDREVRGAFAKKFTILQENEENLLGKVDELRRKSVEQMDKWISEHTRLMSTMNSLVSVLTDDASKQCTVDTLKSHHLTCSELAEVLKEAIDEDSAGHIKDSVASAHFRIADDKLLDLGYIDVGVKEERTCRSTPSVSTQDCMERESRREPDSSRKLVDIAPVFTKGFVYVVKRVKLRHNICGMAALSEEAVVVGYGGSRKGSDCVSISGDRKTHLNNTVGHVNSITFLTDGRPVVGHSKNAFSVYNQQGTHCESKYRCQHGDSYIMVCHDQDDNIYAVNGSEEIFIFKDGKLKRVVYAESINPEQICVTKTGDVMIISTGAQLRVIDRESKKGTAIGDDLADFVHAAVDSQDRVWVAKVMSLGPRELRLTRYALQGTRLIKETTFREISLTERNAFLDCHMVSLTPSRLVFADGDLLYFMELPERI